MINNENQGNAGSLADLLRDQRILIHCHYSMGSGDVNASIKILNIFKKYMSADQLAFCIAEEYASSLESFRKHLEGIRIITVKGGVDKRAEDRKSVNDFAPTKVVAFHLGGPFASYLDVSPSIPTLSLSEYGDDSLTPEEHLQSHRFRQYSLGFNLNQETKDRLGIFINEDLVEYFNEKRNENALYRLTNHLPRLSSELAARILGLEKHEPITEQKIRDFHSSNALYFGYANGNSAFDYQMWFMASMILLNEKKSDRKDNLTFCLPGLPFFAGDDTPANTFSKEFVSFLTERGFDQVEVHGKHSDFFQKYNYKLKENPTGRKIVIVAAPLPQGEFLEVMKAAEKEVLCTGDQSLTDALSAGKRFYYETLSHKSSQSKELYQFINQICQIEIFFKLYTCRRSLQEQAEEMHDHFIKIGGENWKQVIHAIHTQCDCRKRIAEVAARFF